MIHAGTAPFSNTARRATLILVAMLIGSEVVAAAGPAGLAGDMLVGNLELRGATILTSGAVNALSLFPEMSPPGAGAVAAEAKVLVVNWTRADTTSYGWVPNSDDALYSRGTDFSSSEQGHAEAVVSMEPVDQDSNLLVVPHGGRHSLTCSLVSNAAALASPGEAWLGGRGARTETDWRPGPMHGVQNVSAGTPRFEFEGARELRFEGSFTLFIWGTYANVTDADGQTSYRSGSWDDNVVGGQARPRGVARDSHSQILRLTVLEGQLRLEDWAGKIRVAGDAAATETDGQAILDDATGYLESNEFAYTAKQETFKVSGFVSLAIDGAAGSSTRLAVELRGESADTSLPPAGRIPVAAADRVAKVPAAESSTTSSEGFTLATSEMGVRDVLLWSLAGIVVPIVGYRLGARRRARNKDAIVPPEGPVYAGPSPLLQAEEALVRGEPEAARALVKGVLAKDPKDMDAWFVHGASLIRQGSFREAVRDLEAVARQSSAAQPGLAFLLCMAFVGLRKVGKARRWAKVASMEPDFKRQIEMDEAFATLRGPPTAGPAPMIREGATFDPAYG